MNTVKRNAFFLYCRKSQESDERQVQSIDDQKNTMLWIAQAHWYNIVDIITESMSAKAPGRTQFNSMIKRIEKWEAQAIIAWKLDRITRNPVDTGTVQYMLQTGKLDTVHTIESVYALENSGLMFSVVSGMANQFIIDLSKNVKRGMDSKVSKWWFSAKAPEWYINNVIEHTIELDPEKTVLVRRIFDYILTGNYSVTQVLEIANNEWGYRTKRYKNSGWRKLQRSSLYKMLRNIFYTGDFEWKWKVYKWNHPPIITHAEYIRVQEVISSRKTFRKHNKEFTYGSTMKCSCCNSSITAETKTKHYPTSWNTAVYNYYKCTKNKASKENPCDNTSISEKELEKQILSILQSIDMHPEFMRWALQIVQRKNEDKIIFIQEKRKNLEKTLDTSEIKLSRLTDLLLENRISEDEYDMRKKNIESDIRIYKEKLSEIDESTQNTIESVSDILNFSEKVIRAFEQGNIKTRKLIFRGLWSNHQLYRNRLTIELYPWLRGIEEMNRKRTTNISKIGPLKKGTSMLDTNTFQSNCLKWQPQGSECPTPIVRVNKVFFRNFMRIIEENLLTIDRIDFKYL